MTITEENIENQINKINKDKIGGKNKADFEKIKIFVNKVINKIRNNKEKVKLFIPVAVLAFIFMIYSLATTIITSTKINKEKGELYQLEKFNTKILENNEYTKIDMESIENIPELIKYNSNLDTELNRYREYLDKLQSPYSNFLQYILLPSLNIWKDSFTNEIDTSIIGSKFLKQNPYDDIKLIQKRSNFFKDVGNNNEFNQIEDISVNNIVEDGEYFYIPINIKFIANSKRSFLLLIEKLSITSNETNIALINEFMYNLRENIKENKQNEIDAISNDYGTGIDIDKAMGQHLYERIQDIGENKILDNTIIEQTIKDSIVCDEDEPIQYCYYKFRDKYRSIPSIAYTIGMEGNTQKISDLKKILKELPPIITVDKFTFERNMEQSISNYENIQYKGEIQINVYGKGISTGEVEEISNKLGNMCIKNNLNPDNAIKTIENTLINIGTINKSQNSDTSNLRELQEIIEDIKTKYPTLSNYKKIIKTFEIYRMLKEANLCAK
ncbi:MAG TPA: hypothetical protein P5060_01155 [Candidatus Absconditabacterales bacterium]|nr:hypothetical protein [Candidatus Absconditabacterales bacterium]